MTKHTYYRVCIAPEIAHKGDSPVEFLAVDFCENDTALDVAMRCKEYLTRQRGARMLCSLESLTFNRSDRGQNGATALFNHA